MRKASALVGLLLATALLLLNFVNSHCQWPIQTLS